MTNSWTKKDKEMLEKLYPKNNLSIATIAKKLNRSERSIVVKANRIGLQRRER